MGSFILEEGAALSTSHPEGIYSEGSTGCIQTAERHYHSGASYAFTGSSSPQKTGIFTTQPVAETIQDMEISKTFITDILILEQTFNITGKLVRHKGMINKNANPLNIDPAGRVVVVTPVVQQGSSF
jgi:hypothetical protein